MRQNPGTLFFFTGLSGAGKTTIGSLFYQALLEKKHSVVFIDGDIARKKHKAFDYSVQARLDGARILFTRLKILTDFGMDVVCCSISMFDEIREWNRCNIQRYKEIYLKVSPETLLRRDKKHLYSSAAHNVVGKDLPFEEPKAPDVTIENEGGQAPEEIVSGLIHDFGLEQNLSSSDTVPQEDCQTFADMILGQYEQLSLNLLQASDGFFWAYGYTPSYDGLFRLNRHTWMAEPVGIPERNAPLRQSYSDFIEHEGKIYFAPRTVNTFDIFDIRERTWEHLQIAPPEQGTGMYSYYPSIKFARVFVCRDTVYYIPNRYPYLVKYHISQRKLEYDRHWLDPFEGQVYGEELPPQSFATNCFREDGAVMIYSRIMNAMLRLDLEKSTLEVLERFHDCKNANRIAVREGSRFWLFPQDEGDEIIRWNGPGQYDRIAFHIPDFRFWRISFMFAYPSGDSIYLLPGMADEALRFDLKSLQFEISRAWKPGYVRTEDQAEQWKYLFVEQDGEYAYAYDGSDGNLVRVSPRDGSTLRRPVYVRPRGL